jgi:ATP-dependent Zn protease
VIEGPDLMTVLSEHDLVVDARTADAFPWGTLLIMTLPWLLLIGYFDSIGRSRSTEVRGGHNECKQTLNQILSEMDGFEPHQSVVVIAAINRRMCWIRP